MRKTDSFQNIDGFQHKVFPSKADQVPQNSTKKIG